MTSDRLMTCAFALSVAIGPFEPTGFETGLCERALALNKTLLGLRAAKDGAVPSRFRLLKLAVLFLSRPA